MADTINGTKSYRKLRGQGVALPRNRGRGGLRPRRLWTLRAGSARAVARRSWSQCPAANQQAPRLAERPSGIPAWTHAIAGWASWQCCWPSGVLVSAEARLAVIVHRGLVSFAVHLGAAAFCTVDGAKLRCRLLHKDPAASSLARGLIKGETKQRARCHLWRPSSAWAPSWVVNTSNLSRGYFNSIFTLSSSFSQLPGIPLLVQFLAISAVTQFRIVPPFAHIFDLIVAREVASMILVACDIRLLKEAR